MRIVDERKYPSHMHIKLIIKYTVKRNKIGTSKYYVDIICVFINRTSLPVVQLKQYNLNGTMMFMTSVIQFPIMSQNTRQVNLDSHCPE